MINNLAMYWLYLILIIILINLTIRIYKSYRFNYLFSINVETFIDLNGINLITYMTFKSIYTSPLLIWKSKDNLINNLKKLIYILMF